MHTILDKNDNIKLEHCYSHLDNLGKISIGNNEADKLATEAIKNE